MRCAHVKILDKLDFIVPNSILVSLEPICCVQVLTRGYLARGSVRHQPGPNGVPVRAAQTLVLGDHGPQLELQRSRLGVCWLQIVLAEPRDWIAGRKGWTRFGTQVQTRFNVTFDHQTPIRWIGDAALSHANEPSNKRAVARLEDRSSEGVQRLEIGQCERHEETGSAGAVVLDGAPSAFLRGDHRYQTVLDELPHVVVNAAEAVRQIRAERRDAPLALHQPLKVGRLRGVEQQRSGTGFGNLVHRC